MKRRAPSAPRVEQLDIGFEGLEVARPRLHEAGPDTMRQIVSLRMPDALLARIEEAAEARGVSPSSLMRALIAAGLDRSYAALSEPSDISAELAEVRRMVEGIAARLEGRPGSGEPGGGDVGGGPEAGGGSETA